MKMKIQGLIFLIIIWSCTNVDNPTKPKVIILNQDELVSYIKIIDMNIQVSDSITNSDTLIAKVVCNIAIDEYDSTESYKLDAIIRSEEHYWSLVNLTDSTRSIKIESNRDTLSLKMNFQNYDLDTIYRPIEIELRMSYFENNQHDLAIKNILFDK